MVFKSLSIIFVLLLYYKYYYCLLLGHTEGAQRLFLTHCLGITPCGACGTMQF